MVGSPSSSNDGRVRLLPRKRPRPRHAADIDSHLPENPDGEGWMPGRIDEIAGVIAPDDGMRLGRLRDDREGHVVQRWTRSGVVHEQITRSPPDGLGVEDPESRCVALAGVPPLSRHPGAEIVREPHSSP